MLKKVLFIDRDGTLISEPKVDFQVDSIQKLEFEPHVISALLELKKNNYIFIIVTNQDGLGSVSFPLSEFYIPHDFMINVFKSQGIIFDKVLICPHTLQKNCSCRKPKLKLIEPWLKKNTIDKNNSYVIGDRSTDIEFAKNIGISGFLYNKEKNGWDSIKNKIIYNRFAKTTRTTQETHISVKIKLNSNKKSIINTGIEFFNHMLEQISTHGNLYFNIQCKQKTIPDDHHLVEDTGIVIGLTLYKILKNKIGLERYGFTLPMDECIADCIIDISGRPFLKFNATFKYQKIGDLSTEMIQHFFYSLSYSMKITLHIKAKGENDHHIAESLFKVFGKTLYQATKINKNLLTPSSKGIL